MQGAEGGQGGRIGDRIEERTEQVLFHIYLVFGRLEEKSLSKYIIRVIFYCKRMQGSINHTAPGWI